MTTTTSTQKRTVPASTLGRIVNVVRLHFANPGTTVLVPGAIMAFIFLINLAIWWIIFSAVTNPEDRADVSDGLQYSGAALFIFVYMLVVAVQAMNLTFPFALGYSVTRRDYYLGTALTFVILSALWSVVLGILGLIEEATNGWGFGGRMFTAMYFGNGGAIERLYVFFAAFLFFFFVGAATGSTFVRWKANGMYVFFAGLAILLVGGSAMITSAQGWPAVGEFLGAAGPSGIASASLVVSALAGVAGFFFLRKATPKN